MIQSSTSLNFLAVLVCALGATTAYAQHPSDDKSFHDVANRRVRFSRLPEDLLQSEFAATSCTS